jgi:hypothetical protein
LRSNGFEERVPKPKEAAVPRYFFHVHETDGVVEDSDGLDFSDETAARTEAIKAAREIMAAHIRKGLDVSGWSFEIADGSGWPIMAVPFSEAVRR